MADDKVFPDEFVPNIEGAQYHPRWLKANPVEGAKWAKFRDDVIAGTGTPPSMATKYGQALVAAGKLHMSVTDIGSVDPSPDPVEPPPADLGDLLPNPIAASTGSVRYWDPVSGSDSAAGTSAGTAWLTAGKCVSSVPLGGTVMVIGSGVTVTPTADPLTAMRWNRTGGSASLVTTFECVTPLGVRLGTGRSLGGSAGYGVVIEQPGLRLKGFKIGGYGTTGTDGSPGAFLWKYAAYIELTECEFSNAGGMGIYAVGDDVYGGFIHDVWVYRNRFTNNALDTHGGYYNVRGTHHIYGPDNQGSSNAVPEGGNAWVVASNLFLGNMPGRHVQYGAAARNSFIVFNTFYGNTGLPVNGGTEEVYNGDAVNFFADDNGPYHTNGNIVNSNIVSTMKGSAVYGSGGGIDMSGNNVANNLAYNCQNQGSAAGGWSSGEDYPNKYPGPSSGGSLYTRGTNFAEANPLFTSSSDFTLQSGSPANDQGNPHYCPPLDYAGTARGARPNLGAYE